MLSFNSIRFIFKRKYSFKRSPRFLYKSAKKIPRKREIPSPKRKRYEKKLHLANIFRL